MSDGGLSPETITGHYVRVVNMVVVSAVDERGEQIYTRKWNHDFIDRPTAQDCECRPSSRSSPGDCHLPPTVRWRPQGWTPVLHSNREAAFADQYSSAPSACGSEGTKLRESMHWNA